MRAHRLQTPAQTQRRDGNGKTRAVIGFHRHAADRRLAQRRGEAAGGHLAQETLHRLFLFHAQHAVIIAAHARVGHIGRAARQNLVIRRRHMGVRAHHKADAAIEEVPHRLLFAGGFRVHVDDDCIHHMAERTIGNRPLHGGEGIIQRVHVDPAHDVDDRHLRAVAGRVDVDAASRRSGREIDRTQQARLPVDIDEGFALVPDVVAGGHHIGARIHHILKDLLGDAEAGGRILAIHHDEIEAVFLDQARQSLNGSGAAGPADQITQKQKLHRSSRV